MPISRDNRRNRQGGARLGEAWAAAPPRMMAAQQHGPTIWNWYRLSTGNRIRSPVAMETFDTSLQADTD